MELTDLPSHIAAGLVKDRRYHFKKYASCLTGVALVDWLVTNKYATNRLAAIGIGKCCR